MSWETRIRERRERTNVSESRFGVTEDDIPVVRSLSVCKYE